MNHNRQPANAGDVAIRPATPEDLQALAVLSGQLGYPSSPEEVGRRLAPMWDDSDHAVFVAESREGDVVGWVHVHLYHSVVEELQADIGGLVVGAPHRDRGIGQRLLEQAEQWARSRGCWAVYVRSNVIRQNAHRFYQRLGYEVVKTQLALRRLL